MKKRGKCLILTMAVLSGVLMALLLFAGVALGEDFKQDATGGFGIATNDNVLSMTEYDGRLYVGTGSLAASCEVWSYDGANWNSLVGVAPQSLLPPGFGNANNKVAWSMAIYNEELYVGTGNNASGCEVWSFNGTAWTQVVGAQPTAIIGSGFGNAVNADAYSMAVYGGNLYVATTNVAGCEVWSFNGTAWTQVVGQSPPGTPGTGPGFGNAANDPISMAAFGSDLYVGTLNFGSGCEVWDFNGATWTQVAGNLPGTIIGSGFGNAANAGCYALAPYGGELYAGTQNIATGCEVWSLGPAGWTQVVGQSPPGTPGTGPGFGNAANNTAQTLIVFSNHLYASTQKVAGSGCEVWRYDGTSWVMVVGGPGVNPTSEGFGNVNNSSAFWAAVYDLGLYWGTLNQTSGCEIWSTKTSPTWFLAEGATAGGFETWVLVQNPNAFPVPIDIRFQTAAGEVQGPVGDVIPAESRVSYLVNAFVPDNFDVSTSVTGLGGDLICERAVYWTPEGSTYRTLGHDSIGVTTAAPTWYLAEGAAGNNADGFFETWVLVQNPNPVPVDIDMDFQTSAGPLQGPLATIAASSRRSFRVNNYVDDLDVSTRVSSLTPGADIICERAMYWTYEGSDNRTLGHDSIGVTTPSNTWFLAEGATAGGFETWVLIQNPGPNPVPIDMKFQTDAGQIQGPVGDLVPAGSRVSYRVNDYVPDNFDVSTSVESFGGNVICERAMYWVPEGADSWELGHDSRGVTNGGLTWYLAEGATLGDFETFVLVQNPNPAPVTIDIQFQTDAGPFPAPGDPPLTDTIPASSRRTYRVNDYVATFDVSTRVASTAGGFIICERAMYWSPPGAERILGHDSIGFDP